MLTSKLKLPYRGLNEHVQRSRMHCQSLNVPLLVTLHTSHIQQPAQLKETALCIICAQNQRTWAATGETPDVRRLWYEVERTSHSVTNVNVLYI